MEGHELGLYNWRLDILTKDALYCYVLIILLWWSNIFLVTFRMDQHLSRGTSNLTDGSERIFTKLQLPPRIKTEFILNYFNCKLVLLIIEQKWFQYVVLLKYVKYKMCWLTLLSSPCSLDLPVSSWETLERRSPTSVSLYKNEIHSFWKMIVLYYYNYKKY